MQEEIIETSTHKLDIWLNSALNFVTVYWIQVYRVAKYECISNKNTTTDTDSSTLSMEKLVILPMTNSPTSIHFFTIPRPNPRLTSLNYDTETGNQTIFTLSNIIHEKNCVLYWFIYENIQHLCKYSI